MIGSVFVGRRACVGLPPGRTARCGIAPQKQHYSLSIIGFRHRIVNHFPLESRCLQGLPPCGHTPDPAEIHRKFMKCPTLFLVVSGAVCYTLVIQKDCDEDGSIV